MTITMTDEQHAHLQKLVEYVWPDEERDYNDDVANGVDVTDHIWTHIKPLTEFLGLADADEQHDLTA